MTPEEKAMTEKAIQVGDEGETGKVPLREDTFHLVENATASQKPTDETVKKDVSTNNKGEKPATETAPSIGAENVAAKISSEVLMRTIDEKLKKMNRADYLTISINRTGLIFGLGIALIILWLSPVINFGLNKLTKGQFSLSNLRSDVIFGTSQLNSSPAACPTVTPETKIRLKTSNDSLSEISTVEMALKQAGFSWIETIYDSEVANAGILIATRDGNQVLRNKLEAALQGGFTISSESATLTDDSDFAAVILVGKETKTSIKD